MTRVPERKLRRFLDAEMSDAEERELLHRVAEDPEARAMLRFDARLRRALGAGGDEVEAEWVPRGFTDQVMAAIEAREAAAGVAAPDVGADRVSIWSPAGHRIGRLWAGLSRPRTLTWRPAHALVATAAVALALLLTLGGLPEGLLPAGGSVAGRSQPQPPPAGSGEAAVAAGAPAAAEVVLVRFVFTGDAAESVAVAGDFSRWEPIPLTSRRSGDRRLWSGVVAVPRGEHRYMFVVDGRWVTDPLATAVRDDGFGNRNAILSL